VSLLDHWNERELLESIADYERLLDTKEITVAQAERLREMRIALESIRSLRNNPMAG
jgi:hypothetical protein